MLSLSIHLCRQTTQIPQTRTIAQLPLQGVKELVHMVSGFELSQSILFFC